jgi:lipopolysaccharide export system permease protein
VPKKIDWYIIRSFLGAFLLALGLFTIIIIIFDISEKIDEFVEKDVPLKEIIFGYYVNFVPFLLNQFSPIFVFISCVFFTSKLAERSEVVAILSSGVSYMRFLRPYLLTAAFLGVISYILSGWIIPEGDKLRMEFEFKYIRNQDDSKSNIKRQIQPGVIMSMQNFNLIDSFGYRLTLEKIENGRIVSRIFADKIQWNKERKIWTLDRFIERRFLNDSTEMIIRQEHLDTQLKFDPAEFFRRIEDVQAFNMRELDEYIKLEQMRGTENVFFYQTEKYRRYSGILSILVLTFIAVCVSSIKTRGGVGLHLGKGLIISFVYLFVIQFFHSYGSSGVMNPILAVTMPNVMFAFVGLYFYRVTQK